MVKKWPSPTEDIPSPAHCLPQAVNANPSRCRMWPRACKKCLAIKSFPTVICVIYGVKIGGNIEGLRGFLPSLAGLEWCRPGYPLPPSGLGKYAAQPFAAGLVRINKVSKPPTSSSTPAVMKEEA